MQLLSYEEFCDIYYDDIYCEYMESGAYYEWDVEMEDYEERAYEDYLKGECSWVKRKPENNT
jgi:hypothetical protein